MKLTKEQESELLKSYDHLIWRYVHRYKRKSASSAVSHLADPDDLYQECAIVLLNHFRKARTEEELRIIPRWDMENAMCLSILSKQNVSVPMRTGNFKKTIESMSVSVEYSSLENMLSTSSVEDMEAKIVFDSFVGTLPEIDQAIIQNKMSGRSNRETAKALGLTDVQVTRHLQSACGAYHRYVQ